ncbi:PREDICTED: uncharacterized mitochondrial protein AtMg00810-like [Prunus mume]|uniref:Uncharacterized mitochondrial protein AtMg00810-like n=1 Tax=Prunus mume TaxID=102107 RepID=A0ABM1LLK3_PRUMU|nr:PREDICTED: uncharacterized mitochondrial protein AtMg00810-like [Prunus mume]
MVALHYFLGVEVLSTNTSLFLTQHKYIRDLLDRTNMSGPKETHTPMATSQSLCLAYGSPSIDVSFTINKLAQFMHYPSETHWAVAKRLLCYLKNTLRHGLLLRRNQPLNLHAFSNSDWAGNRDYRTSTTAYIVYLGNNTISWCSQKQKTIDRSSTESEYRAIASTTAELTSISSLLTELGITMSQPDFIL